MRNVTLVGCFLLTVCALSSCAYTVEDLEQIASAEIIVEISRAAGLALVDTYAATKTAEELTELAQSTRIGIAYAARMALRALHNPLEPLVLLAPDELRALSRDAATPDERLDAARAYFLVTRAAVTREMLEREAASDDSAEWALAAGEVLGGFYATYSLVSTDDLVQLAIDDPHPGVRRAASVALAAIWVGDGLALTDREIEAKLVELMQWRPDLAAAYADVLAHRFLTGLERL